jgi:hypothetical protein
MAQLVKLHSAMVRSGSMQGKLIGESPEPAQSDAVGHTCITQPDVSYCAH